MQHEYWEKKVYYCETKVGYWIQKHNWTVQTRMIFADTVIRNIVHIPFITVTEHITHECCWYRYEKWTANMFCMKKRTARKHSEMTDSMKRQRQKETDMCTHKKKRNALYFMHFWKWNNLRVSAHVCLLLSVPFRAVYHFAVLQNQLAHKQALTAGSFPRLWHVLKEMTVREEYFTVHVIQDIMSWPHWKDTSGTLFKILC